MLSSLIAVLAMGITSADSIPGIGPVGDIKEVASGLNFTEGPVSAPDGSLYFSDVPRQKIHHLQADGEVNVVLERSKMCNGLAVTKDGKIVACQGGAGAIVSVDPATGEVKILADGYQGKRFNQPNDLVLDSAGGVYFTDPVYGLPSLPQKTMGLYYVATDGAVTRLAKDLELPNGIGLSPDGKTLYVVTMGTSEVMKFHVDGPGKLSAGMVFCELESGGDGMTVDGKGNVYVTQPDQSAIDVFDPQGDRLGRIEFPAKPANCAFAGPDRKTLYVTARRSIYAVRMNVAGIK